MISGLTLLLETVIASAAQQSIAMQTTQRWIAALRLQ